MMLLRVDMQLIVLLNHQNGNVLQKTCRGMKSAEVSRYECVQI